jgi:DNA-binding XRE family transcriptional regulator
MTRRFAEIRARRGLDPGRRGRIEAHKRAMRDALALAELREARNATQVEMAGALGVSQANVSRIEYEEDIYLSALGNYVEALGGRLEIAAVFPDQVLRLGVTVAEPTGGAVGIATGRRSGGGDGDA